MYYRNFASKQKFYPLKKIGISSNFSIILHRIYKGNIHKKLTKIQFFSKSRIFVLRQIFDNSSDRIWDNGLFYKSPTSDVSYVASKILKNLRSSRNQDFLNKQNHPDLHRIYKGKSKPKSSEIRFSKFFWKIILMKIPLYKMEFLMKRIHFNAYLNLKCRFLGQVRFLAPYSNFNDFINWP